MGESDCKIRSSRYWRILKRADCNSTYILNSKELNFSFRTVIEKVAYSGWESVKPQLQAHQMREDSKRSKCLNLNSNI